MKKLLFLLLFIVLLAIFSTDISYADAFNFLDEPFTEVTPAPTHSESATLSKNELKNHKRVCPVLDGDRQLIHSTAPNLALQSEVKKRRSVSTLSKPRANSSTSLGMVRGNGERSRTKARGASNGLIQTPWGEVQTPMAILPYFYCPICKKDVNIGDCSHNRQDFTAPVWIREFALWKKGKFEVEGEKLEKFRWLRDNAVVFSDGFESGDYSAWMQNGTPVVSSSFAREGTYSSNTNASNEYVWQDLATAMSTMYYRFYVYINSMTLNSGQRLGFAHVRAVTKTSWLYGVYLYNNGTNNAVILRYGSGVNLGLSWKLQTTVTMTTGVWYCLETKIVVDNTNGSYTTWLDGNQITGLDVTGIDNDDLGNADRIHLGGYDATAAAGDVFSDSVIVDDANYIGPINDLGVFINDALINNAMIR